MFLLTRGLYSSGGSVTIPAAGTFPVPVAAGAYCTDEDVAAWDGESWLNLVPRSQVLASGVDGVFTPAQPWILTSVSNAFANQGCVAGCVCAITGPATTFPNNGRIFAIDGAAGNSLRLRTVGRALNVGQAPGPAAGATGVEFTVWTFTPQIATHSTDLRRQFDLDAAPNRSIAYLSEAGEELRQVATLRVLRWAYLVNQRLKDSDAQAKLGLIAETLSQVEARLNLKWGKPGFPSAAASNIFDTRVGR